METPARSNAVRAEVDRLLDRSQAFAELAPEQQRKLREDMARVAGYLADPAWIAGAQAQALPIPGIGGDPVGGLKQRLADKPAQAGKDFKAGALKTGVDQFGKLVKKVDFPKFVSGLVNGVFNAVVTASIQQMQAYGELLAATAMTVDQFARDHITDGQAREYVAGRYPSALEIDASGEGGARLRPRADQDTNEVTRAFNLRPGTDLSDEDGEKALVAAARTEMARSRQQLLATMVLMGINRIVVTNGKINAKVVFDVDASDTLRRGSRAGLEDDESSSHSFGVAGGLLSGIFGVGASASHQHEHSTSVMSAVDETSESQARMKAHLSGDVSLAFRSETFPLERMADMVNLQAINQRAQTAPAQAPVAPAGGAR